MTRERLSALAPAAALLVTVIAQQPPRSTSREDAYRANNVGVALLEQFNDDEAASSFRRALTLDPNLHIARLNLAIALLYSGKAEEALTTAQEAAKSLFDLPQPHYIVGLAARAQGRTDDAAVAFRRVLQLDPADAGSRINLGQIALQERRYDEAIRFFREAVAAESFNVTAAYGLAIALTRSGAVEEGRAAIQRFEKLRDIAYGVTYSQTYLEQGRYGEAIASTGAESDLVDPNPPAVIFADATASVLPRAPTLGTAGDVNVIVSSLPGGSVTLFDADGDGDLDAFATSTSAAAQRFFVNDSGAFTNGTERAGLTSGTGPSAQAAVAADYDNDGKPDLFLLRAGGNRLLHQRADGRFEDVSVAAGIPMSSGIALSAAFVDVDHDGDLDIFAAGAMKSSTSEKDQLPSVSNQLLRNNGNGTFTDIAAAAGVAAGVGRVIGVVPTDFDNRRDMDLLVVGAASAPRLFQNVRDGSFRDVASDVGLPRETAYSALAAADVNKDGYTDFFFARPESVGLLALSDGRGRFTASSGPDGSAGATTAQFVDYDNDGLLDLFAASPRSARLFRNIGGRWSDETERARLGVLSAGVTGDIESVAFGDLDRDGDTDGLVLTANGELRCWRNDGGNKHRALLIRLAGRVSNRGGVGAKVDLRAGSLRQRVETSAATPALAPADVLLGLGPRASADVVRVIWPSGTLQAETTGERRALDVTELDRKPSSCPYLYTWNGTRFEFVTDFMGGGEIGYWLSPGVWNTPDPDEYVRILPGMLVPRGGRYELRVTNELEEALFIDRLQLVAVDHLDGVDVFPKEGLGARPAGPFALTTTRGARPPAAAVDEHGHDMLPKLRDRDRTYPDDFALSDIRGYAEPHELRLDLGSEAGNAVLLATGWTDYAFSSDNVAAHQRGVSLSPPSLDVRSSSSGAWRRLVDNIGIPVGRPQTVVVDLRGKLRAGEREVRILTNMRIYWDQLLVDVSGGGFDTRITRLDPAVANLRWRGFSADVTRGPAKAGHYMKSDGGQPFTYDYDRVSRVSPWKTMVGRYTREGDVRELLQREDDMFVIARPGDEIALTFDRAALRPLGPGRTRTFLLYAYGFSKEMDITSATPHAVEPLPFRAMRRYPYGADQHYPSTAAHREYQEHYNTRVVSRTLPPLEISGQK